MKLYKNEHFILQRLREGLTQTQIADSLGVTQGFVAQVEGGSREMTGGFQALYPKKLRMIQRHELVFLMLRRLGMTHGEAKQFFNVRARTWNKWLTGRETIPDHVVDYLKNQLKIASSESDAA